MAKYELSMEDVEKVNEIARNVFDELGGQEIKYEMYQALIAALKPAKDIAKNNSEVYSKQLREAAKQLDTANAEKLHKSLKVGDKVSYSYKSLGVIFEDVSIEKMTDKRFHVEINADTDAVLDGKRVKAGELANLKLGTKYVAFEAIQSVNGLSISEFLSNDKEEKVAAAN